MAAECAVDQVLGGRYALVEALGHGASGVVWRARDQLLQRDVAVKEIRSPFVVGPGEGAAFRDAILREARAAARLNHPGAVTVYDVVEDDGRPLIVMELVDAPTLAKLVDTSGPLPPAEVALLGTELLDALDAGHTAGIVHRDVKPGNVMVDGSGRVRLADFGVAAVLDDVRMTTGSAVVGSPAYMAPEQVTGEEVGRPADLWALGATMYFAVEGCPPYDKGAAVPTMMAIVREPPRPPTRAGALGPVLEALLTKDPAARPTAPFLRLWLAEVAGGGDLGLADDIDSTRQYPVTTDIEVPQGPAAPMGPGPTGPRGPVVIPKPTPAPEPTVPAPEPERVPPVPPTEPVPVPAPAPAPERVPAEPDPLEVPSEPDPLVAPPAPPVAPQARQPSRAPRPARPTRSTTWVVVAVVAVATVAVVAAILAGRGTGGGGQTAGGDRTPATSGASTAVPADWIPYVDPSTGFTISRPPGWTVVVDGSLTDFRDPSTGAYLRVDHVQPPGPSPEGAWRDFEPRFQAENPGYQRVRIEPTTFKGFPAAIWEYTYGSGEGRLRAVDLGFVTGDYGFALNFQTRDGDWQGLQPVFDGFKAGFRPPA